MVLSTRTRPTALWVTPVSDIGGVARHVLDVVTVGLPDHRLVVLCPPGPLADRVAEAGGAVLTGPIGPAYGVRRSAATLRHAVRTLRPQIVHSHLSYADIIAAGATPAGPLLVTTEHGIAADDGVYHGSRAAAGAMARVHQARLRRFGRILAVSEATAQAMRRKWHPRRPIVVVPNGVARPAGLPHPEPGLRILSLARLATEKRLPDLLTAFARVAAARPDATLTLAGDGPARAALEEQVRRLGLVGRVRLPGFVDPGPALQEADVVAQLSVWENCSYTLLDAIAHGTGVVASAVGGNPEILPTRCLVDPADPAAVADLLLSQGLELGARPTLPEAWPDVSQMAAAIGRAYEGAA